MGSEGAAGNKYLSKVQEEFHLGHPQDILGVGERVIIQVEVAMVLDKIANTVCKSGVVPIHGFNTFYRYFVQIDDIVEEFRIPDDPQFSTTFESFISADMWLQYYISEQQINTVLRKIDLIILVLIETEKFILNFYIHTV